MGREFSRRPLEDFVVVNAERGGGGHCLRIILSICVTESSWPAHTREEATRS
jgi:hypothetical protein